MTITLNAKDRKPLIKAVSEFAGKKAVYMKMPTCAYQIGGYTVTRECNLITPEDTGNEAARFFIQQLATAGFLPEDAAELFEAATDSEQDKAVGLTVSIPLFPAPAGIHRGRVQYCPENPAPRTIRQQRVERWYAEC